MSDLKIKLGKYLKVLLLSVFMIVLMVVAGNYIHHVWEFWDTDPDRGATTDAMDQVDTMGDRYSKVVYPNQNWTPAQSLWFYTTTQGSDLIPYDFFLSLEQKDSNTLFRDNANMNRYRYLVQKPTWSNPDGLPVGMVKDQYQGTAEKKTTYMGFTCAACHTTQVNVVDKKSGKSTGIRIDGGPATADMVGFMNGLAQALEQTRTNEIKRARFVKRVLEEGKSGQYRDESQVLADLATYALRIRMYNTINHSDTDYGYARLDAFGRIYNRVLEHLLTREDLLALVKVIPGIKAEQADEILSGTAKLLTSQTREQVTQRTVETLMKNGYTQEAAIDETIKYLAKPVFNTPNAPVSYPFLWDIAQHDYVQWNGIGVNAGVGPLGRNVGEVIGVFGTLDWRKTNQCRLAERLTGQCTLLGTPSQEQLIRFESSVKMRNLGKIETQLASLTSPRWDDKQLEGILPALDWAKVTRGKALFDTLCVACHQVIDGRNDYRKVVAFMQDYKDAKTDRQMVENALNYTGRAGYLKDLYVDAGPGSLVIQERMPVAALLTYATKGTVATPNPDEGGFTRFGSWLFDIATAFSSNPVKASLKQGNYPPDTSNSPFASLQAYKGRPLNGIWGTAPYLHNGSVPTLYDLLLPAECPSDRPGCEKRPSKFMVGSRVFDTTKVGITTSGYAGFEFDTQKPGNSNQGHNYGTTNLSSDQRMELVEYMKSL